VVAVGWLVATVGIMSALTFAVVHPLLRANAALTRALIASNPKELAMLDKAAAPRRRKAPPESEGQFFDPEPAPLGLRGI
jgi:hypothetical protein